MQRTPRFFQTRRVDGMILTLVTENRGTTFDVLAQVDLPNDVVDREIPVGPRERG